MSMNDRLLDLLGLDDPQPSSNQGEPEIVELEEDDLEDNEREEPATSSQNPFQVDKDDENIVYFGGCNDDPIDIERQKKMEKVRQSLRFSAPGEAMRQEFTTTTRERKARAKRSMARLDWDAKEEKREKREHLFHDVEGRLVISGESYLICDCLQPLCPGCHSPCEDCHSRFCGPICQKQRDCVVVKMEICGGDTRLNPWLVRNGHI